MLLIAIYASLMALALGIFTSMTFVALAHIFIIIPCFYFLPKTNYKNWSISSWFLLGVIIAIILSIIFNQDIMELGYKSITKVKYYLIALLSIAPYSYWWVKISDGPKLEKDKKIRYLLVAFLCITTIASISGMMGVFFGMNPLRGKMEYVARNGGLSGMLINYAHNLAYFQIIVAGLIVYRKQVTQYISEKFLYSVFLINLLGLYTTYTRGALLALLIGIPFLFLKFNIKRFAIISTLIVIAGLSIYKFSGDYFVRPDSDIERKSQWSAAIVGFQQRPILGLGYLNFERLSQKIKQENNLPAPDYGGHAHSNYLEMLASTGLVGFVFFMLWQIAWFVEMVRRDDIVARIAVAFIVVFVVGGLTQATFVLGANLFFIMPFYALTQINRKLVKNI